MKSFHKIIRHDWLLPILAVFFSTVITIPSYFFGSDFMFQNHDLNIHLIRLMNVEKALFEGVWLPNWNMYFTNGLGSPVFLLNWSIPYYLAILFRLVGFNLLFSIKAIFLLSFFASGCTFYVLMRGYVSKWSATIATILFLWAPYRMSMIFIRGSFGETVGIALLPIVLYFVWNYQGRYKSLGISLSLALLVLSHNILALFGAGLSLLWICVPPYSKSKLKPVLIGLLGGVLLTFFFWYPAIVEKQYTNIHLAQNWYKTQFLEPYDLLFSPWQYGPAEPTKPDTTMSFQIGTIHALLVVISLYVLWRNPVDKHKKIVTVSTIALLGSLLFQLYWFQFMWEVVPILTLVIFPWRFQSILIIVISLLIGLFVNRLPYQRYLLLLTLIIVPVFYRHQLVTALGDYSPDDVVTNYRWHDGSSMGEFLPRWADRDEYIFWFSEQPKTQELFEANMTSITNVSKKGNQISFDIDTENPSSLRINHYYFPGWKLYIDDVEQPLNSDLIHSNGRMSFDAIPGTHSYVLRFERTRIRKLTLLVSAFVGMIVLVWIIYTTRKKIHE